MLGDFNCVLGAHEKRGGILPNVVSCSEFPDMHVRRLIVNWFIYRLKACFILGQTEGVLM